MKPRKTRSAAPEHPQNPDAKAQVPDPSSETLDASPQPPFTEEDALAFFARHLDGLKWKYHRTADRPTLFSGFSGSDVRWDFNVVAQDKGEGLFYLGVNSFIPNKAPVELRKKLAEMLTRINWELNLGCFEMNNADGESTNVPWLWRQSGRIARGVTTIQRGQR